MAKLNKKHGYTKTCHNISQFHAISIHLFGDDSPRLGTRLAS